MNIDRLISPKVIAPFLTLGIIFLLIFTGPAQAFTLSLDEFSKEIIDKGEKTSTTASINIQANEIINLNPISVYINDKQVCVFNPNDNVIISGCTGINIALISNLISGYGYGY